MIKVTVKTAWMGDIAIHEKYVKQAETEKKDILITYEGRKILIPYNMIQKFKTHCSTKEFLDKFNREPYKIYYKLYYFKIPKVGQQIPLFE